MTTRLCGLPGLFPLALSAALLLVSTTSVAGGQRSGGNVVVGPTKNAKLQDGAGALYAGKAEDGIELTLAGLKEARSPLERRTGLSNLCAGYLMLEQLEQALKYCVDLCAAETLRRSGSRPGEMRRAQPARQRDEGGSADAASCEESCRAGHHGRRSARRGYRQCRQSIGSRRFSWLAWRVLARSRRGGC
jgi:hypothetical protein